MIDKDQWAEEARDELEENILPFWMEHVQRPFGRGFYGLVRQDGSIVKDAPLSAVVMTRLLWTFSKASRVFGKEKYLATAENALNELRTKFWDEKNGGLYWMVHPDGQVLSSRKQIYAQAFGIYALAEHYLATKMKTSLDLAIEIRALIERHSRDQDSGGYYEAFDQNWEPIQDLRLSEKDLNCPKTMNTHLHILEAYTNLLRVWPQPTLQKDQRDLAVVMMDKIVDIAHGRLNLFFDTNWCSLKTSVSFGHDIEASWLMVEAAEVLKDGILLGRARDLADRLARSVLAHGVDPDGSTYYEAHGDWSLADTTRHWWVQAEAVVGFYDAYQVTGKEAYRHAAYRGWQFIQNSVVDRTRGEWHAKLGSGGVPLVMGDETYKAGPWKCPYHNARACFELLERLQSPIH